jgi:AraC-like DNA-binding protein
MQFQNIPRLGTLPMTSQLLKDEVCSNKHSAIQFYCPEKAIEGAFYQEQNTLLFIRKGKVEIRYGGIRYEINENKMAFIKKNIYVAFQTSDAQECCKSAEYFLFVINDDIVKEFMKLNDAAFPPGESSFPILIKAPNQQILNYVETLESSFRCSIKIKSSLIRIKLLELLFYLAGCETDILHQLYDIRNDFRTNITTAVEENIMNSLSLQQLAILSGRSLSSFRRDFQAIYNMPPSHYIRQKRLEKARQLLLSTTMSVTDVCYITGFESIAHFSRLFKSNFHYSPSEFRLVNQAT